MADFPGMPGSKGGRSMARGGKLRTVGIAVAAWMIISSINKNEAAAPGATGQTAGDAAKVVNDTFVGVAPQVNALAGNVVTVSAELLGTAFKGLSQVGGSIAEPGATSADPRYQGG